MYINSLISKTGSDSDVNSADIDIGHVNDNKCASVQVVSRDIWQRNIIYK